MGRNHQLAARISQYKARRASDRPRGGAEGDVISAATLNRELATLRHLLRLATEEWEVLPKLPRVRLEKEPEGRIRWLERNEEQRPLAACRQSPNRQLAAIVTVAIETGMRLSEILGLTWARIDLTRGVLRLEHTKSGRRREVLMRQAVYNLLAAMPAPRTGRLWPDQSIRTAWENAVAAAGIEDFTFHDLRHHFASWFMMRGGSLQALREILGHRDVKMTL